VKPENVMVRSDGYVKVLDFGLARVDDTLIAEQPTQTNLATSPGTLLGTAAYMSPEAAQAAVAGPPSDVFALGVMLYEMIAGQRPFVAATNVGVLAAIVSQEPVPLGRLKPTISQALDDLVHRMLAKTPDRRPSAADVVTQLTELQTPGTIAAAYSSSSVPERHTVGRELERATLRKAYARVKSGDSLLIAVTGEAGIGKSSLTEDFLREIASGAAAASRWIN